MIPVTVEWWLDPDTVTERTRLALDRRADVLAVLARHPLGLNAERLGIAIRESGGCVLAILDGLTREAPVYEYTMPGERWPRFALDITETPVVWRAGAAYGYDKRHQRWAAGASGDDWRAGIPDCRVHVGRKWHD